MLNLNVRNLAAAEPVRPAGLIDGVSDGTIAPVITIKNMPPYGSVFVDNVRLPDAGGTWNGPHWSIPYRGPGREIRVVPRTGEARGIANTGDRTFSTFDWNTMGPLPVTNVPLRALRVAHMPRDGRVIVNGSDITTSGPGWVAGTPTSFEVTLLTPMVREVRVEDADGNARILGGGSGPLTVSGDVAHADWDNLTTVDGAVRVIGPHIALFVDGVQQGRPEPEGTNIRRYRLTPGPHEVVAGAEDGHRWTFQVNVAPGTARDLFLIREAPPAPPPAPPAATPAATQPLLRVRGMPHYGAVSIDGVDVPEGVGRWEDGTYTGWLVPLPDLLQHTIAVRTREGERREQSGIAGATNGIVQVKWDVMPRVSPATEPAPEPTLTGPARIVLVGAPPGWPLVLDGSDVAPEKFDNVRPGAHVAGVRGPMGEIYARPVSVEAGGTATVDVTALVADAAGPPPAAPPAPGRIVLVGAPSTWPILFNGSVVSPETLGAVAAGPQTVGIRPPTGADLTLSVNVPAGGTASADFTGLVAALPPPSAGDESVGRLLARNIPDGWRLEIARRVTRVENGQTLTSQMPFAATTVEALSRGLTAGEYAVRAVSPDGARIESRVAFVPDRGGAVEVSFAPTTAPRRSGVDLRDVPQGYTVSVTRRDNTPVVPPFVGGSADAPAALLALQEAGHGRLTVVLTETLDEMWRRLGPQPSEAPSVAGGPPRYENQRITTQPLDVDVPEGAVVVASVARAVALAAESEVGRRRAWDASRQTTGSVDVTGVPASARSLTFVLRAPFVMREGRQVRAADFAYPLAMGPSMGAPLTIGGVALGPTVDASGQGPATATASVPQGFYSLEVYDVGYDAAACNAGGIAIDPRCAPAAAVSVEVRIGAATSVPFADLDAVRQRTAAELAARSAQQRIEQGEAPAEVAPLGTYPTGRVTVRGIPRDWMASVTQQVPPGGNVPAFGARQPDGSTAFDLTGSGQLAVTNKLGAPRTLTVTRSVSANSAADVGRAVGDLVYARGAEALGIGITSLLPDGRKAGFLAPEMARLAAEVLEPGAYDREWVEFDAVAVRPEHAAALAGKIPTVLYAPGRGFLAYPLTPAQIAEARRSVATAQFGDETFLGVPASTIAKATGLAVVGAGAAAGVYFAWQAWFSGKPARPEAR